MILTVVEVKLVEFHALDKVTEGLGLKGGQVRVTQLPAMRHFKQGSGEVTGGPAEVKKRSQKYGEIHDR